MSKSGTAIAAVIAACLTGCSQPTVCTTVGWINTVNVSTSEARVDEIVCVDGCETPHSARSIPGGWQVQVGIGQPDAIIMVALDDGGAELGRYEVDVTWQQLEHGPCGGPGRADPVTLPG